MTDDLKNMRFEGDRVVIPGNDFAAYAKILAVAASNGQSSFPILIGNERSIGFGDAIGTAIVKQRLLEMLPTAKT